MSRNIGRIMDLREALARHDADPDESMLEAGEVGAMRAELAQIEDEPPEQEEVILQNTENLPFQVAPGIYFNMPEEEYHRAFALSASGIKHEKASPMDFWARTPLNPLKEDVDSAARMIGRAYHKRILEGSRAFYALYAPEIERSAHPGAVETIEEIKGKLASAGVIAPKEVNAILAEMGSDKTMSKLARADWIAVLRHVDPSVKIWDDLLKAHSEIHDGRTMLAADLIRRIEVTAANIEMKPSLAKALSGGYPEVSIFWIDYATGVPMKIRVDYLKLMAFVDYKTFENPMGLDIDRAIARFIANYKAHVQARLYLEGGKQLPSLIKAGLVFGAEEAGVPADFIARLAEPELAAERKFVFIFQQKGIAPVARGMMLPQMLLDIGEVEIGEAKATFVKNWNKYGVDPWVDTVELREFAWEEFPGWVAE